MTFRRKASGSFLDVMFQDSLTKICGEMSIPTVYLDDYSKELFRNLIAFEMNSNENGRCVMAYCKCLSHILQREDDVEHQSMPVDLYDLYAEVRKHHKRRISNYYGRMKLQYFPNWKRKNTATPEAVRPEKADARSGVLLPELELRFQKLRSNSGPSSTSTPPSCPRSSYINGSSCINGCTSKKVRWADSAGLALTHIAQFSSADSPLAAGPCEGPRHRFPDMHFPEHRRLPAEHCQHSNSAPAPLKKTFKEALLSPARPLLNLPPSEILYSTYLQIRSSRFQRLQL
uniref:Uncharacterized protein n=1 Tax=Ananas comosus var. bracteatus TaxID=296719 RepID=A0A6V7P9Q6_ANACO|nr:unnamed protein product [Ananas comosus var. bracteatus]